MFNLPIKITYIDGRVVEVSVRPATQVAFEREFKTAIGDAFTSSPKLEHVYFMAWHASKSGVEFDAWLESVDGIELGEVATADPTPPAVSAG